MLTAVDVQQLERVAAAVQPHLKATCAPSVSTVKAAIVLASDESISARAACRAVGINESSSGPVRKLASKIPSAVQEAQHALAQDPRDGMFAPV